MGEQSTDAFGGKKKKRKKNLQHKPAVHMLPINIDPARDQKQHFAHTPNTVIVQLYNVSFLWEGEGEIVFLFVVLANVLFYD